ncbi:MAG: DUF6088 family protein [Prevotellaceae bacterium]|jgi:hypothetical protein|nr:DUF6088 family protein [Prevotellaceae bacterium]
MFFSSDFASYGGAKSVLKALERLTKAKVLLRLSQGIYYYPKMDKELGIGILYPSLETRNHPRFQPSQLSHCQEKENTGMLSIIHRVTPRHSQNYRIHSQDCAASIAVLHGDAERFVKAVKAGKSNETL